MSAPAGVFITLEGGEGAGKSSLIARLHDALRADGLEVVVTREPGGTPGANSIRTLLVQGAQDRWSATSELLLLTAARNDHVERLIGPALQRGAIVLCDRFRDSTRAYQIGGRGASPAAERQLCDLIGAPTPDLTLLLDIDPAIGVARSRGAQAGEARYESMDLSFHRRVREAFLQIAHDEPARVAILDASKSPEDVLQRALALVRERLLALRR